MHILNKYSAKNKYSALQFFLLCAREIKLVGHMKKKVEKHCPSIIAETAAPINR